MTLQQQQQPGVVLGADRSIMPVVSVSGVGIGVATASQMNTVPQSPLSTVQQLPLPVCFYIILFFHSLYHSLNHYSKIFIYIYNIKRDRSFIYFFIK